MNKKLIAISMSTALLALPLLTLAFSAGPAPTPNTGLTMSMILDDIFRFIWPIIVAFIIIMFIIAGFLFITAQGDPGKIAQGRNAVIWGVVGIVVVIVAYSIVFFVRNSFQSTISPTAGAPGDACSANGQCASDSCGVTVAGECD